MKGHYCGRKGRDKYLYSAIDLEGHVSSEDNRMYVIDYSRTMPPVFPKGKQRLYGQQFFCMFRSEFLKGYNKPLSADGYTNFQSREAKENDEEIKEATVFLIKHWIPLIAKELNNKFQEHKSSNKSIIKFSISKNFHSFGINVRYSGYMLEHLAEEDDLYNYIVVEVVARVVKNRLRELMR